MNKIVSPASILFETVAGQLAATFYDIGRAQGMTSKYKTARAYGAANIEKFLPKAISYCIDMLARPDISEEMKQMIYDALSERVNDPNNITSTDIKGLGDLDIKKLIDNLPPLIPQQLKKVREKPTVINTNVGIGQKEINKRLKTGSAIGKVNG